MIDEVSEFAEKYGSIESGIFLKDELLLDIKFTDVAQVGRSKVFYVNEDQLGVESIPIVSSILQGKRFFIVILKNNEADIDEVSECAEKYGSIESGIFLKDELLLDIKFTDVAQVGRSKVFYVNEDQLGVESIPIVSSILQGKRFFIVILKNNEEDIFGLIFEDNVILISSLIHLIGLRDILSSADDDWNENVKSQDRVVGLNMQSMSIDEKVEMLVHKVDIG